MGEGPKIGKTRRRNTAMPQTKKILNRMVRLTLLAGVGFIALLLLVQTNSALAATSPTLNTPGALSYAVLGATTVTNTGNTIITGDVGVYAGSAVTGFPPGLVNPPGTIHAADTQAQAAQADNLAAFGALDAGANATCDVTYVGTQDLTLVSPLPTPGVYCATAFTLSGNLQLTGNGVYVFKSASSLITSPGSSVTLVGATPPDPCDVWWRIGSSAVLDTTTTFVGNILALTSITLNTGASLDGRALAQTGQVSLNGNNVSVCSGPAAAPSGVGASKIFNPAVINSGGVSTLTITLTNADSTVGGATITTFTDNLPAGMTLANPSFTPPGNTCGGTLSAPAGGSTVLLTGGTIPAASAGVPGFCTITVNVTAVVSGTNLLPAGALITNRGNNLLVTPPAGATLRVRDNEDVPTLNEWGIIIFMGLAGLGSVYYLRRRRV